MIENRYEPDLKDARWASVRAVARLLVEQGFLAICGECKVACRTPEAAQLRKHQDNLLRAGITGRLPSRKTNHWFSSAAIIIDILESCPTQQRCNCLWSDLAYERPEDAHWLRIRQIMCLHMTENMGLLECEHGVGGGRS